jgi:sugar fermentation stimulation protein A
LYFPHLVPAVFVKRPNRFIAEVRLEAGGLAKAFVPTTGRLTGVLKPGCRVWLAQADPDSTRKTPYTLVLAKLTQGGWCCVEAIRANHLFEEAVQKKGLDAFLYENIEREVSFGKSRLDFRLSKDVERCWIEVKSVTFVEDGVGRFPDAPTSRGRKHLLELADLAARGDRVSVVLIAQREDMVRFMPFDEVDPLFGETLRQVHKHGVEIHAYRCRVNPELIEIAEEIPVDLSS